MNFVTFKQKVADLQLLQFRLPDGQYIPSHFHITEIGLIDKQYIDCGGVHRRKQVVSFTDMGCW